MTDRADDGKRAPSPTFGELARLFVSRQDVKFWQTGGAEHANLYWVRAMTSEEVEKTPCISWPVTRPQSTADRLRFAEARAQAYGFLAHAFEYPNDDFLIDITTPAYVEMLAVHFRILADNAEVNEGLNLWAASAGAASASGSDTPIGRFGLSPLREDYTRMIYDSNLPCIPPYESVYWNERQVMGKQALAVETFYHEWGLAVEGNEIPDHIALECEFVARLAGQEAEAWRSGMTEEAERLWKTRRQFLTQHLLSWGGKFCADLRSLAQVDFYRAVAHLGSGLFNDELLRLKSET